MQVLFLIGVGLLVVGVLAKKPMLFGMGVVLSLLTVLGYTGLPKSSDMSQVSTTTDGSGNIVVHQGGQAITIPPMFQPQGQPAK